MPPKKAAEPPKAAEPARDTKRNNYFAPFEVPRRPNTAGTTTRRFFKGPQYVDPKWLSIGKVDRNEPKNEAVAPLSASVELQPYKNTGVRISRKYDVGKHDTHMSLTRSKAKVVGYITERREDRFTESTICNAFTLAGIPAGGRRPGTARTNRTGGSRSPQGRGLNTARSGKSQVSFGATLAREYTPDEEDQDESAEPKVERPSTADSRSSGRPAAGMGDLFGTRPSTAGTMRSNVSTRTLSDGKFCDYLQQKKIRNAKERREMLLKEPIKKDPEGCGEFFFKNGNVYHGEFVDNFWQGYGSMYYKNGNYYEGEWLNDKFHGKGTFVGMEGDMYVGDFINGNKQGSGTYELPSGMKYTGEWMEGKKQGRGVIFGPSGTKYEGQFKEDAECGWGIQYDLTGEVYEGEFSRGSRHGFGTNIRSDGVKTEEEYSHGVRISRKSVRDNKTGNFDVELEEQMMKYHGQTQRDEEKKRVPHGLGRCEWVEGSKEGKVYFGQFKNGSCTGHGTLEFPDGGVYKGDVVEGLRHGFGIMSFADGSRYVGEWNDDQRQGHGVLNEQGQPRQNGEWLEDMRVE